jgi:peptide-methionine (S)-S-oxide reductase
MGNHTECFEVDYDPSVISYEDVLERFWQSHNPTHQAWKPQYASVILAHDDEQMETARTSAEQFSALMGKPLATRIELFDRFWLAEDYHQKYYLRGHRELSAALHEVYPDERAFTDSTAAARLNGYLYGAGTCARLERDLPLLAVSDDAAAHLRSHCTA